MVFFWEKISRAFAGEPLQDVNLTRLRSIDYGAASFPYQASTPEEARALLMKTVEEVNPSEISFTERAAMRTQCRKLAKFMQVVCFIARSQ